MYCVDHYTLFICYLLYFFYTNIIFILGLGQILYAAWLACIEPKPSELLLYALKDLMLQQKISSIKASKGSKSSLREKDPVTPQSCYPILQYQIIYVASFRQNLADRCFLFHNVFYNSAYPRLQETPRWQIRTIFFSYSPNLSSFQWPFFKYIAFWLVFNNKSNINMYGCEYKKKKAPLFE